MEREKMSNKAAGDATTWQKENLVEITCRIPRILVEGLPMVAVARLQSVDEYITRALEKDVIVDLCFLGRDMQKSRGK